MKYELDHEETTSIFALKEEKLDSGIAPDLKSQIILLANTSDTNHLILDLSKVTFADSSGLSALLLAHRLFRDSDRQLVLCGIHERVKKLLTISHLDHLFAVTKDRKSALKFIAEQG